MSISLWAMLERLMSVADVVEEMNLVPLSEKRSPDAVHRCVSPALVVEAALLIQEVEELSVALTAPQIKVANLKVAPDCMVMSAESMRCSANTPLQ